MIAPVQNLLAKDMLTHIGIALTLGGATAYTFWHKKVLADRELRHQYYIKVHASKDL